MTQLPTRLTREYGVEHPIVAAGMAFVCTPPELAIAVCHAGGIGSRSGPGRWPTHNRIVFAALGSKCNVVAGVSTQA